MARNKTEKMTVSFERPELIKKLVGDIAIKENRSLSAIIEKIILTSLMPENSDAKWIAEQYLYSEDGGIGRALSAIFSNNSAGVNWEAVHDNMLPLVQFASTQEVFCAVPLTGKEKELNHAYTQIQSVIDRLARLSDEAEDAEKKFNYEKEKEWGMELLQELKEEPECSNLFNFYQLVLNNWKDFKNWTITYRMLDDLVKLEKGWRDDPEARMELLHLLKNVSAEW